MSEKETNRRQPEASTEDKMQELFRLMDEKAAQGTLVETEEDVSAQKERWIPPVVWRVRPRPLSTT